MEPRESQDLFNQIADVIDFIPERYDQTVWGTALTLERFRDSDGVVDDTVHMYEDDECSDVDFSMSSCVGIKSIECGTCCCVAGWTALLEGWHPTIEVLGSEDFSETYLSRRLRDDGHDGYIAKAEHKVYELNYQFVASEPGVEYEGWQWEDVDLWHNGVLNLGNGVKVGRVDIVAQKALGISAAESSVLFNSDLKLDADDLRLIGKGEDIIELCADQAIDKTSYRYHRYGLDEGSVYSGT